MVIDPELKRWATDRQAEYVDAVNEHGSSRKAGEALGVNKTSINDSLKLLRKKAAAQGYSPEHDMVHVAAPGYIVKGISTLYNADGQPSAQWVKTTRDAEEWEQVQREAIQALSDELPRAKPSQSPTSVIETLLNHYTLTDAHIGALCWRREGGDDWDLQIAEETFIGCFKALIDASPAASVGFLNQLGDFMHWDGLVPVTPSSGHILDADGRFSKMVSVAIRILRRIIAMLLEKHESVVLLIAEGNHDMASSVWLRLMFKALYEDEPRISVIDSELPYYSYEFGLNMIAAHHGHKKGKDQLPLLFAAQFPDIWGRTKYRVCHTGHMHHVDEREHSGMTVHQHATLAARDAYAARGGWISHRQATSITYHRDHGEVARNTIRPEMLEI